MNQQLKQIYIKACKEKLKSLPKNFSGKETVNLTLESKKLKVDVDKETVVSVSTPKDHLANFWVHNGKIFVDEKDYSRYIKLEEMF